MGFHIVVSVVSVASAAVTAAERSPFQDTFLLYLPYESLAVVSINKMLVSVVGDRIIYISGNMLYLSYLSYWAVVCEVSIWLYLS